MRMLGIRLPLRSLVLIQVLCFSGLLPLAGRAAPAGTSSAHDAGAWDLTFEKGNRRCRLFLRTEASAGGFAVAMPAGCKKAFPSLGPVTSWVPDKAEHILLMTDAGATAYDFAPNGTASLAAIAGENEKYELTPLNPAVQDAIRAAGVPAPEPAPEVTATATSDGGVMVARSGAKLKGALQKDATALVLPPASVDEVAGNYAVLRQDRDTGCMVTLEPGSRSKTDLRAKLAPACRDQGIVIFDPVGWQLFRGSELVLTAKKGHTTALMRRDQKTWANAPPRGVALILKRL